VTAAVFLHEPMGVRKILGAAAVLVGVALTRMRVMKAEVGSRTPDPDTNC